MRVLFLLAALLSAPGCAPESGSTSAARVDLTLGFVPAPLAPAVEALEARAAGRARGTVTPGETPDAVHFELPLPRELWSATEPAGDWLAPIPRGGALGAARSESIELGDGARVAKACIRKDLEPGRFVLESETLRLRLAPGEDPQDFRLRARIERTPARDGRARFVQGDLACAGLTVYPGVAERVHVTVPPASQLVFGCISPTPLSARETLPATTFRVRLADGAVLFEHRQELAVPVRTSWHRLPLPLTGEQTFVFEIEGGAPAGFARPALVPVELGTPAARPSGPVAPDLVLFLADTFRADNLAVSGGDPALAPTLNAFLERALVFSEARATAAWTLPSIGALNSGVFPGMHGGTSLERGISPAVETIAEVLAAAGYRTAAVTDSGLFSRHYGQDQGFEWFEEVTVSHWNLRDTLTRARAQLAADDGRPLFLMVHSYRVHGPMRLGPDEDPAPWSELIASNRERLRARRASGEKDAARTLALELVNEGRRFYLDSVSDLDRKVGAWFGELEGAGFLERGYLAFTADHGNAYGENDEVGHGGRLYDVKLSVPLALWGPELTPEVRPGIVSLVDLAPTLAALARVAPARSWVGRSLLAPRVERVDFAFSLEKRHHEIALYQGGKKLLAPDTAALRRGEASHAFDLVRDPGELTNQAGEAWASGLARSLADGVEPWLVPLGENGELELSPEVMAQLEAIGYAR